MKKSILLFVILFASTITFSQLSSIYYELQYNEGTDLFDCKLYANGVATTAAERLQMDAKYSIIVETGTTIAIADNYFPIYNNETYTGTVPMTWSIESVEVNPPELPGYDIIGIVPDISGPPAHYNNLSYEDYVTLFSLSAVGGDICPLSLRVFENDDDPTSLPSGNEFANTMQIGGPNDIYDGNLTASNVTGDVDVTVNQGSICQGDCIILTATFNCIFPGLTYEWSTGESTESITVCPNVSTQYVLNLYAPFEYGGSVVSYINVNEDINTGEGSELCVGVPVDYLPESGLWTSSDENIVTVNNEGTVLPISQGTATISHTTLAGECYNEVIVTVLDPEPPMILGENEICADEVTQLSPNTGVTWQSGNPAVATVDNTGLVTGVSEGSTVFIYTTEEGCESDPTPSVNVLIIPEPKITGLDTICRLESTMLTPSAGVTWESSDTSVAKIDNSGHVTGVSEGSTTFYFTDMATGCISDESEPVTVLPSPTVQVFAVSICEGDVMDAETNFEGGQWILTVISGSPNAAIITNNGTIESNEPGVVSVQYISKEGCISDEHLLTILPIPTPDVTSNSPICIGDNLMLSANSPAGTTYSYQWTGPNGFSSNEAQVIIPNSSLSIGDFYTYTLIASDNGCESDEFNLDVVVEDCDPCGGSTFEEGWIKIPASMTSFSSVGDYEVGGSLVSGREVEDFVYYNYSQQDVRLVKNNGNGYFEEEIVLFELPYLGPNVKIDIVDIDQDGLSEIITYQSETSTGTNGVKVTISTHKNLDNFSFEHRLSIMPEPGDEYILYPVEYVDIDNQGFLDIVPYFGAIYFTENWEENSVQLPAVTLSLLIEDFNEDGLLDILGIDNQLFINNGDRTFELSMMNGYSMSTIGLYDSGTGVFVDGIIAYQITKGDSPSIDICWDPGIYNPLSFFYANINSNSFENGLITSQDGFHVFESPMTCQSTNFYEKINDFIPNENGKIDFTGNGYSDFVTFEDGNIFVWINPNEQPKLRGTAFIDNNGDGILNENDSPLRNVLVSIEPGNLSVLTDANGNYQFTVPEGTYTLTANVNEGEWVVDELVIENVEVNEPCNLGFDFGFVPDPTPIPSVNISMVNTIARCDFETRFTITVENTGTEPFESQLQFEFDDKTTFFSTGITGATIVGNKVTTDIGPLPPFQPQKYIITVKMPGGSSQLPLLGFKASLLNNAGEIIETYGYEEQLRCSYDPNDKRTFPDREGDDNLTLMDEDIEYTIRFQNNGNDTAYNVRIIDPIDINIEPSSIRVVGSSHAVETCIEGTDLIFLFENIYLVDSTTDYASSQGYVTFKCNAKEGLAEFTKANNTADIFFDTNPPISTNQTLNTLVSELCTDKSTTIYKFICEGEEYLGYNQSGIYTESYELAYGCDSLVTINLWVQGITYAQQSFDLCKPGTIFLATVEYYIEESTTIIDTIFNDQGCISSIIKIEITLIPDFIEIDSVAFCIGETGLFYPMLDGLWHSDDESVVTVDDQGNITSIGPGEATLQFSDFESGCIDEVTVVVFPEPVIMNEGNEQICINETTQLTSDNEGFWSSSNTEIATITTDGLVLGKEAGPVTFTFTNISTGCYVSLEMEILPSSDSNCTVSIDDLLSESVIIYPNPATTSIFIESIEIWNSIRLINAQGQVILTTEIGAYQPIKQIDLNGVSSGLYLLLIERGSEIMVRKFIVD